MTWGKCNIRDIAPNYVCSLQEKKTDNTSFLPARLHRPVCRGTRVWASRITSTSNTLIMQWQHPAILLKPPMASLSHCSPSLSPVLLSATFLQSWGNSDRSGHQWRVCAFEFVSGSKDDQMCADPHKRVRKRSVTQKGEKFQRIIKKGCNS